jgi:aminomethyltransferase
MYPLNLQETVESGTPGHDLAAEFQAALGHCGLATPDRSRLELRGSDRVRWLNGMVTNNVRDLALNRGVYAFVLNPQGRILADLYAYNCGETVLVETDPDSLEKLTAIFDRYIIMDDVEVTNVSDQTATVSVSGPAALQVVQAAGFEVPNLDPLEIAGLQWQGSSISVVRKDNPLFDVYEIWVEAARIERVRQSLTKAGAVSTSRDTVELLRIAAGLPRYGQDIREKDLPQETGQTRALNFSKGCYIGQEIVERIRSRGNVHRQFSGFLLEGPLPANGSKIRSGDKEVGEINSAAALPYASRTQNVALGYIRREAALPGVELSAEKARLTPVPLPFRE